MRHQKGEMARGRRPSRRRPVGAAPEFVQHVLPGVEEPPQLRVGEDGVGLHDLLELPAEGRGVGWSLFVMPCMALCVHTLQSHWMRSHVFSRLLSDVGRREAHKLNSAQSTPERLNSCRHALNNCTRAYEGVVAPWTRDRQTGTNTWRVASSFSFGERHRSRSGFEVLPGGGVPQALHPHGSAGGHDHQNGENGSQKNGECLSNANKP